MNFRYCPRCGQELVQAERGGQKRPACPGCGFVHYRNPTVGVAVVLRQGGNILLGRRAAGHSFAGAWCMPCGHVEWGEDVRAAACREFKEETGLTVTVGDVVAVHSNFHNPQQLTVGIWFEGTVIGGDLHAGDDLDRVGYFPITSPPTPLAFPTDELVLDQLALTTNYEGMTGE